MYCTTVFGPSENTTTKPVKIWKQTSEFCENFDEDRADSLFGAKVRLCVLCHVLQDPSDEMASWLTDCALWGAFMKAEARTWSKGQILRVKMGQEWYSVAGLIWFMNVLSKINLRIVNLDALYYVKGSIFAATSKERPYKCYRLSLSLVSSSLDSSLRQNQESQMIILPLLLHKFH